MNLSAVRGDTNIYSVTVVRQNNGIDLTGGKMWFTAKADPKADDVNAAIALNNVDDPTQIIPILLAQGKFQIELVPDDTDDLPDDAYFYDIQVKEADGIITTIASGVLHIVQDVTRASS